MTANKATPEELAMDDSAVPVAEVPLDPINVSLHHPESYCHKCGGRNITWFAPNELWNTYAGDSDIICPICFAKMAEEAGCNPTAWKLSTENLSELEEIRLALAGSDISSLPSDFPTVRMAHQIRADHDKFLWQIRDTCTRAETAEAELDAAKRALAELQAAIDPYHSRLIWNFSGGCYMSDLERKDLDALNAALAAKSTEHTVSICSAHQTPVVGCPRCHVAVTAAKSPLG